MNNGEVILSSIRKESADKIAAIREEADKVYEEAMEKARSEASAIRQSAEHKVQQQSEKLIAAHKSRAALERRNALLKTRRLEIEKAVAAVQKKILTLPDAEYFDFVLSLASQLQTKSGVIFFNQRDLSRLPADFQLRLKKIGFDAVISKTPQENISGGFILKKDDVEENMSIEAVIAARREMIEDLICRELFKD